jgi:urease gamma subunit
MAGRLLGLAGRGRRGGLRWCHWCRAGQRSRRRRRAGLRLHNPDCVLALGNFELGDARFGHEVDSVLSLRSMTRIGRR